MKGSSCDACRLSRNSDAARTKPVQRDAIALPRRAKHLICANLDIVESPTPALHAQWRAEMGATDDPSDQLCPLWPQLKWLCEAGLTDVDCIWKWRSLALMRGEAAG